MICTPGGGSRRRGVVTTPREAPSPVIRSAEIEGGSFKGIGRQCSD